MNYRLVRHVVLSLTPPSHPHSFCVPFLSVCCWMRILHPRPSGNANVFCKKMHSRRRVVGNWEWDCLRDNYNGRYSIILLSLHLPRLCFSQLGRYHLCVYVSSQCCCDLMPTGYPAPFLVITDAKLITPFSPEGSTILTNLTKNDTLSSIQPILNGHHQLPTIRQQYTIKKMVSFFLFYNIRLSIKAWFNEESYLLCSSFSLLIKCSSWVKSGRVSFSMPTNSSSRPGFKKIKKFF